MTDAPTPQRAASAEERDAPVVHGFAINPPGGPDIFVEGNNRFCHEHEFLAYRKHALDRITAAEARAEEAEAEIGRIDEALRLPAEMSDGERLARILGRIEDAQEHEGDAENRADAATADRDRLADEVARLRGALKPFAGLRFSFDGFSCDPATLVFQHREYGQWRSDDHAAFEALIDAAARALTVTGGTTDGQA